MIRLVLAALAALVSFVPLSSRAADLTVGLAAAPSSADPYYHNVGPNNLLAALLFDHLVTTDANAALHPQLATKWEIIDDRTWRFTLSPDAHFQDGGALTANDVVYSLCRPLGGISPTASFTGLPKKLAGIDTPDPHTVILRTLEPDPLLLNELAGYAIISAHSGGAAAASFSLADRCGGAPVPPPSAFDGGTMANGSGRYRLESYTNGDVIVLRGNTDHAGAKPRWDKVTLRPVTNTGARVAGLLAGDFDMIVDPAAQDLPRLKQHGGFAWTATPSDRIMFLQPDIGRASSPQVTTPDGRNPLRDPRVRQAISLAIDRRAIVERLMDGLAVAADQYAPPAMPGAVADPPPRRYDPAAAKKLLAEAGYPDGFALTLAATNDRYINDAKVAQALGQFLTRIGIKVNVDVMPQTVFFPSRPKRLFSLSLGGWGMGDASTILRIFIATTDAEHGIGTSNYGGYSSAAFDKVLNAALVDMDQTRRDGELAEAARIALQDDALIPLYWETSVWAYKDRFTYAGRVDQLTDVDALIEKQ
jgi:peptide/nickel transport system substrate-binding protein